MTLLPLRVGRSLWALQGTAQQERGAMPGLLLSVPPRGGGGTAGGPRRAPESAAGARRARRPRWASRHRGGRAVPLGRESVYCCRRLWPDHPRGTVGNLAAQAVPGRG